VYPSLEVLLGGAIGFVLSTCHSVVDHVCALMLLAKQTIFFLATFLGDPFIKGDDLFLEELLGLVLPLCPSQTVLVG
jgi:hypothetical protein